MSPLSSERSPLKRRWTKQWPKQRRVRPQPKACPRQQEEPELVSRPVQAGIGLLTGVAVFGTALGGLFAIAFALAYRRMGDFTPRATSALVALLGFVSVYLTPILKYPAKSAFRGLAGHDRHADEPVFLHASDFAGGDDCSGLAAQPAR